MPADSITMTDHRPHSSSRTLAAGLVAAMALGSVVMWVAVPAAWVLLAAQVSETRPTLMPLMMIFIGAPLTMLPAAKLLGVLDRRHQEVTGTLDERRRHAPWNTSMRDSGDEGPRSVLAVVMVTSVALAFVALGVWFFLFAGSSLPSA